MSTPRFKANDVIISDNGTCREILDVCDTGYGWRYPDLDAITPAGGENYFRSENSTDPFFELGWRKVAGGRA